MSWIFISSGAFLGWALGANDAANVFGTAVGTRVIRFRTAVCICAAAILIGAIREGQYGIGKLGGYAAINSVNTGLAAFVVMLAAGLTVTVFTFMKLPVSTSQCVIGSIIGWGLSHGTADFSETASFVSAWVVTPFGSMVACFILCKMYEMFVESKIKGLAQLDFIIKAGYMVSGALASYSLGASNVANATGIYLNVPGIFDSAFQAALVGGIAIALGVLTYSKPVMFTVGEGITQLSPVSGFLVVLSCIFIVYPYALIGIPVSVSQAVIGAVIGAGLVKGVRMVKFRVLKNIALAWFATPIIPGIISFAFGTWLRI